MEAKKYRNKSKTVRRAKATTAAVLTGPTAPTPINPKWLRFYERLLDLRQQLGQSRGQLIEEAAEERTPPRREAADVGTDAYDRDWALSMASSEQDVIYEIDEAINRIHSGTYGTCELTGKPIPAERLDAIPWTRFTAQAERKLEADGQTNHTQLAPRQTLRKNQEQAENQGQRGKTEEEHSEERRAKTEGEER